MNIPFRPKALLLDFGGVIYTSKRREGWQLRMTELISSVVRRAHVEPPSHEIITRDLEIAHIADDGWKTAASRMSFPPEISDRQFFGEFLAAEWDSSARAAVLAERKMLSREMVNIMAEHYVREGVRELLDVTKQQEIPVVIVSNTRSGAAFRSLLRRDGLSDYITAEIFSEEVEIRKPNPLMLQLAAATVGTDPKDCWFAGDHYDRDIMCARRAGIGIAALIHDEKTASPPFPAQVAPDLDLPSPRELAEVLARTQPKFTDGISSSLAVPSLKRRSVVERPRALLLDHGGVIVTSFKNNAGRLDFARRLLTYLRSTRWEEFDLSQLVDDIERAHVRHDEMKVPDDASVIFEVSNISFWRDLVAADWPDHPRAAVAARCRTLMTDHIETRSVRTIRSGIDELLSLCRAENIPVGIVSNTLCGQALRNNLISIGIAPFFATQIYSDELGRRKPDPTMILAATEALGVEPQDCWYVGDKPQRDLLCGRRAEIGVAILMRRPQDSPAGHDADLVVDSPNELTEQLKASL